MKKRLALLLAVALLGVGATAATASGEPLRVAQETGTEEDDDGGSDYGWIGLLGLAGLAGLLGRNKHHHHDHDRMRTTGTTGTTAAGDTTGTGGTTTRP